MLRQRKKTLLTERERERERDGSEDRQVWENGIFNCSRTGYHTCIWQTDIRRRTVSMHFLGGGKKNGLPFFFLPRRHCRKLHSTPILVPFSSFLWAPIKAPFLFPLCCPSQVSLGSLGHVLPTSRFPLLLPLLSQQFSLPAREFSGSTWRRERERERRGGRRALSFSFLASSLSLSLSLSSPRPYPWQ